MLRQILADILKGDTARNAEPTRNSVASRPRVLNVGGGSKTIPIGAHYADWEHVLADVDPRGGPDIVCHARKRIRSSLRSSTPSIARITSSTTTRTTGRRS